MHLAYYNEFDPFAASWLENLISKGLIADGYVDRRSIRDVRPGDLDGFTQCHFFAGIGGWSYALRLAGWQDHQHVWTGSCPCQPFSGAGRRKGVADDRHLWPELARLVSECAPSTVFGEQVASADGRRWLASVRDDLETLGYEVGAADLCAPGAGAFHIRQRLYWGTERLADPESERWHGSGGGAVAARRNELEGRSGISWLGDADDAGSQRRRERRDGAYQRAARAASLASGWEHTEWIECSDGKARPIEPGTFPLANGLSSRVGRLRGYGNAIVPQVAADFVTAWLECMP